VLVVAHDAPVVSCIIQVHQASIAPMWPDFTWATNTWCERLVR